MRLTISEIVPGVLLATGTSDADEASNHCQIKRGTQALASFDAMLGEEALTEVAVSVSTSQQNEIREGSSRFAMPASRSHRNAAIQRCRMPRSNRFTLLRSVILQSGGQ